MEDEMIIGYARHSMLNVQPWRKLVPIKCLLRRIPDTGVGNRCAQAW
jgi:hypothetical protein